MEADGIEPPHTGPFWSYLLGMFALKPLSYWLKNSISKATLPKAFPLKLNPGDPDRFRNTGGRFISGEPSRKVRRLRRCLTIFTGVISSSGAIVAGVGNAQPRPQGYGPCELTSALPHNVLLLIYKNCAKLTNFCKNCCEWRNRTPPCPLWWSFACKIAV